MGSKLFKVLLVIMILAALYMCNRAAASAAIPHPQPQYGDHLCWYSSTKKQCGTYGWARNEKAAQAAALKLCLKSCDDSCVLDYCEKLEK